MTGARDKNIATPLLDGNRKKPESSYAATLSSLSTSSVGLNRTTVLFSPELDLKGIAQIEGLDDKITAYLTPADYANLKKTSRDFSGPVALIPYRKEWTVKAYNSVAYCGQATEDAAPGYWQQPLKRDSIFKTAASNCCAAGATGIFGFCCCGNDAPVPDSWQEYENQKSMDCIKNCCGSSPCCVLPSQAVGCLAGSAGGSAGLIKDGWVLVKHRNRQHHSEFFKNKPLEAAVFEAPDEISTPGPVSQLMR